MTLTLGALRDTLNNLLTIKPDLATSALAVDVGDDYVSEIDIFDSAYIATDENDQALTVCLVPNAIAADAGDDE